jgi:hypothetical protein
MCSASFPPVPPCRPRARPVSPQSRADGAVTCRHGDARTDGAVTCRHGDARNGIGWVLMLMRSWMWFGGGRVPAGRAPREALEHVRRVGPEQVPSGGPPRAHAPCFRVSVVALAAWRHTAALICQLRTLMPPVHGPWAERPGSGPRGGISRLHSKKATRTRRPVGPFW